MKKLVSFINGWTAFGWLIIVGAELYKLGHAIPTLPGAFAGGLALIAVCASLFFIGIYNFVSIDKDIDADAFFS